MLKDYITYIILILSEQVQSLTTVHYYLNNVENPARPVTAHCLLQTELLEVSTPVLLIAPVPNVV